MANILEFLRSVLTEPEAQGAFRADPSGYVEAAGFVDLTGEDVVEAMAVLRRSLPQDVAGRLAAFDDEDALPPVRPRAEESELDAAIRLLSFAVDEASGVPEPVPAAASSEPIDVENELDTDLVEVPPAAPAAPPTRIDVDALPSIAAFSESLAAIVVDTRAQLEEAAASARSRLATVLSAADADAARLRAEGEVEREAARVDAARMRAEADDVLARARQAADDARARGDEDRAHGAQARAEGEALLASAAAETEATRAELAARRAEIREAERQLKVRVAEIDSLFRTVLRDEDGDGISDAPATGSSG